ncbi:catalase [Streptomyces vinaceus]|uniref:catalase n=1 Tax=Streptomyces vinaceus TaxID=1960 RepID=UPI00380FCAFA
MDGIERVSPPTRGLRRVHGKGYFYRATFTSSNLCAPYTTAAHFGAATTEAVVRFSNGARAGAPDTAPGTHGMATRFRLADGTSTDIVALNLPVFFAATPEDFLELIGLMPPAGESGAGDGAALGEYLAKHPRTAAFFRRTAALEPPASYGTSRYWAVHAFRWTGPDARIHHVRYRWEPALGVRGLSDIGTEHTAPDYLDQELRWRVANGTVRFRLMIQFAGAEDPTDDSTVEWPADRKEIDAGHLEIRQRITGREAEELERVVLDPNNLTPGIEASDDPILEFRRPVYGESRRRRIRERG